jgi:tripartite-type tricarboxylate transporter receptor subunit TctC
VEHGGLLVIRYVISFPVEANIRAEFVQKLAAKLKEAVDDREWRDIVLNQGGTITDMRHNRPHVTALVRRARARAR